MKKGNILKFTYFLVFSMMFFTNYVYAYLDPSTITYAIQIVAGVFIAGGATVGIYWHKIKMFFRNKKKSKELDVK